MEQENKIMTLNISGIKCDHCDYSDMEVEAVDYPDWLNRPCPKCGENLLTEADYQTVLYMTEVARLVNSLSVDAPVEKTQGKGNLKVTFDLNGTGKATLLDVERLDEPDAPFDLSGTGKAKLLDIERIKDTGENYLETKQKSRHVYQDHLGGGIYLTDSYDKSRLRRCGQCGESDNYLGVATTFEQLLELCRCDDEEEESDGEPEYTFSMGYMQEVWTSKTHEGFPSE